MRNRVGSGDGCFFLNRYSLGRVAKIEFLVGCKCHKLFLFKPFGRSEAAPIWTMLRQRISKFLDCCIGAAKAADTTMSATVESKKREDMDTKTVTHGLVLLVVHLKKLHIRVLLCQLTYLRMKSLAATTARREEVNDNKLITSVGERVNKVLS